MRSGFFGRSDGVFPHRDQFFSSVTALLHLNGANGSTIFTDIKVSTWSGVGSPSISTAQGEFGSSLLLNGTSQYIEAPSITGYELAGGDFTVEATVYLNSYAQNEGGQFSSEIISKDSSADRGWYITLSGTSSSWTSISFTGFDGVGGTTVSKSMSFILNTIYRIRVVRSSNTIYIFVNGSLIHSGGFSRTIRNSSNTLKIGSHIFNGTFRGFLPAYIWEVRVTKGIARSTSSYTFDGLQFPDM